MHTKLPRFIHVLLFLGSIVGAGTSFVVLDALRMRADVGSTQVAVRSEDFSSMLSSPLRPAASSTMDERIASRLQRRIQTYLGTTVPFPQVLAGLHEQHDVLSRSVMVTFQADDGRVIPAWTASVQNAPQWMAISVSPLSLHYAIDEAAMAADLAMNPPQGITLPVNATLASLTTDGDVQRGVTDGVAKQGDDIDPQVFAHSLAQALLTSGTGFTVPVATVPGRIVNATGQDLGALTLIASGRSNFAGSGNGRKANVRKGLGTYLNDVFIPADADFGINSVLANVPQSEWEMALGIFDGGTLRMTLGGGLCQVATTLYRAALSGGFPILSRISHSLFVHYYEKYGVGIDATIYPGHQDMKFHNDTGHPLLIQSYTTGDDEAFVNVYGTSDGRSVSMDGPYFSVNAPSTLTVSGRHLYGNEIAWLQHVRRADGQVDDHTIVSRYKEIPSGIVVKYLHAAAAAKAVAN